MAMDRAQVLRSSRVPDDLTLSGLLDVLDRADDLPLRGRPRPARAVVLRPGQARSTRPARGVRPLPPARPVPVPRPRPPVVQPPVVAPEPAVRTQPRPGLGARLRTFPRGLAARLRTVTRRLALWGAGPGGANLAWGRPVAPAPRADGPVVLTELPSTPTIQPVAPSPAAALVPARAPRPVAPPRVPVVPPLARQVPAPRPTPSPGTAPAGHRPGSARASGPARARGDPRPPPARGQPHG
ncbi:hypothetical protein ACI784_15840 [Geodermatophilus sp. SYSU D01186]